MPEICGDIGPENRLSKKEKFLYLFRNALRGITEWSLPGKVKGWKGRIQANGSDSPGRIYVDSYLRRELPKLVLPGKIRVLDIGCGTGYVQKLLAELGYAGEYVGLDVVQESGFAKHTDAFDVSFVMSRIEDYAPSEKFDLVLSNTALEHIYDDRKAAVVAANLLKDDGIGVHTIPSYWSLFLYLFHGYRQYTPKMLRRVFSRQRPEITALGGLGSFLVHFTFVTLRERVLGGSSLRQGELYQKVVGAAAKLDRFVPLLPAIYAVVVRGSAPPKTRVLFAIPSILFGGIEQQLVSLLRAFDRTRFELCLLVLFEYPGRPDLKDRLPEDLCFEVIGMRNGLDFAGWGRLIRLLKEWAPDVVVSSMFSANTALRLLKPFFRYSVIAREHNIYDEKKWWQTLVDRILAGWTCRIIAVSKSVAHFASRQASISPRKFTVIQNGVDLEKLQGYHALHQDKRALKLELGLAPDETLVLTVGRLKPVKNHAALIRGFADFAKERPDYRLVVIGNGVERPALQELVQTIPNERVVLLERYGDAVWPYYAAADWFILPSLREGFPNVMLEAMAFGLPLLGTDISGTNECIEDGVNGYFIPQSASGITGSLRRISKLQETQLKQFGEASLKRVADFTIEKTVRRYEACLVQCAP